MNKDYPIIRERKWISKEEAKEFCPDKVLHAIECDCHECLDKWKKVKKENG